MVVFIFGKQFLQYKSMQIVQIYMVENDGVRARIGIQVLYKQFGGAARAEFTSTLKAREYTTSDVGKLLIEKFSADSGIFHIN